MNLEDRAKETVAKINADPTYCTGSLCTEHGAKFILDALQAVREEDALIVEASKKYCNCHTARCWCGLVDDIAEAIRGAKGKEVIRALEIKRATNRKP